MFKQLWNDESGGIISSELVLVGTIMVIGTTVGLSAVRDAVLSEMGDLADAVGVLDQSYTIPGVETQWGAKTEGTVFVDERRTGGSVTFAAPTAGILVAESP